MTDPRRPFPEGTVKTSEAGRPEPELEPEVRVEPEPEIHVEPKPPPDPAPEVRVEPEPETAREEVVVPPDEADTVELALSDLQEAARAAGVEVQPDTAAGEQEHEHEDAEADPATVDQPAGSPIDPRIHERRIAVTRAEGRRRLRVLLTIVALASALGVAWLIVQSPFLAVDTVTIRGTDHQTPDEVRMAAGVRDGAALLFVDTGAVARRVEALPWVARAKVVRELPNDLTITVAERLPMAWIRRPPPSGSSRGTEGAAAIVDATGRVLGDEPVPPAGLSELEGIERVGAPGSTIAPPDPAAAVAHLPEPLRRLVGSLSPNDGSYELILTTPAGGVEPAAGRVKLGRLVDVEAKGAAALAVLDQLAAEGTRVSYIDVRVPGAPATR